MDVEMATMVLVCDSVKEGDVLLAELGRAKGWVIFKCVEFQICFTVLGKQRYFQNASEIYPNKITGKNYCEEVSS